MMIKSPYAGVDLSWGFNDFNTGVLTFCKPEILAQIVVIYYSIDIHNNTSNNDHGNDLMIESIMI